MCIFKNEEASLAVKKMYKYSHDVGTVQRKRKDEMQGMGIGKETKATSYTYETYSLGDAPDCSVESVASKQSKARQRAFKMNRNAILFPAFIKRAFAFTLLAVFTSFFCCTDAAAAAPATDADE